MKVDAQQIQELRLANSWSQEELAIACGITRRTIQRIEAQATASLQSIKALASVLNVGVDDLRVQETPNMAIFEYKTINLPFKFGVFKKGTPDLDSVLNREADDRWRLKQIVVPASSNFGNSEQMVAILERERLAEE